MSARSAAGCGVVAVRRSLAALGCGACGTANVQTHRGALNEAMFLLQPFARLSSLAELRHRNHRNLAGLGNSTPQSHRRAPQYLTGCAVLESSTQEGE